MCPTVCTLGYISRSRIDVLQGLCIFNDNRSFPIVSPDFTPTRRVLGFVLPHVILLKSKH